MNKHAKHAKAPMILTDLYLTHHQEVNSEAQPDLESSRHSEIAGKICIVHRNHCWTLSPRPQGPKAPRPNLVASVCSAGSCFKTFLKCEVQRLQFPCASWVWLSCVLWSTDFQNFWVRACLVHQTQCLFWWQMFWIHRTPLPQLPTLESLHRSEYLEIKPMPCRNARTGYLIYVHPLKVPKRLLATNQFYRFAYSGVPLNPGMSDVMLPRYTPVFWTKSSPAEKFHNLSSLATPWVQSAPLRPGVSLQLPGAELGS